ncbi:MAG: hypothetical protein WAN23_07855 [Candidatus Acidiferrales bacterium]
MELARRKQLFTLGIAFALVPIILWVVLPESLFPKIGLLFHTDTRLVEAYSFMAGAGSQFVAAWFFNRSHQRPRDWISVCAIILTVCSGIALFVFFCAMIVIAMQGF